jgi:hypothetical protein
MQKRRFLKRLKRKSKRRFSNGRKKSKKSRKSKKSKRKSRKNKSKRRFSNPVTFDVNEYDEIINTKHPFQRDYIVSPKTNEAKLKKTNDSRKDMIDYFKKKRKCSRGKLDNRCRKTLKGRYRQYPCLGYDDYGDPWCYDYQGENKAVVDPSGLLPNVLNKFQQMRLDKQQEEPIFRMDMDDDHDFY